MKITLLWDDTVRLYFASYVPMLWMDLPFRTSGYKNSLKNTELLILNAMGFQISHICFT
jgi:hypothetical protein